MFLLSTWILLFATATSLSAEEDSIETGEFHGFAHGVKSGPATISDDNTIKIKDFHYDGDCPDSYFVVGTDDKYIEERPSGGLPFNHIIRDENGSCKKLKDYDEKTIELTLPGNVKIADIKYLAVYCISNMHNFGYLKILKDFKPPPAKFDGPTSCQLNLITSQTSSPNRGNDIGGYFYFWLVIIISAFTL